MPPPKGTYPPLEGPGDYTTTETVHSETYPAIDPAKADFSGKAIFVSGASRGLGKAIALAFAKAGASHIAIGARSSLAEVEKDIKKAAASTGRKEPHLLCLKLEITDASSIQNAAAEVENTFGKLDVLINNAGVIGDRVPILESDPDSWWQTCSSLLARPNQKFTDCEAGNVNVRGPYLVSRALVPLLLKGEQKTIVTISSVGAHVVNPGLSDYQSSKLAVLRLTEFVAKEHAEQGLVAFSVHPGNMPTDMVGDLSEALKPVFVDTPELCADGLVYLTKERREWLSGRYINCTWDMPELVSPALMEKIVSADLLKVRLMVP